MEGKGVKKILTKMKAEGLVLDAVIHDDDASTIDNTRAIFGPQVKEHLDINHQVKGVKKKILTLARTVPDFENYANRIASAVRQAIRQCRGDPKVLVDRLQRFYRHYQGDHSICDHVPQAPLIDPSDQQWRHSISNLCLINCVHGQKHWPVDYLPTMLRH